ncbi:MAG TPA: RNA 2',3'-cyclic phosphodiesterase [Thermoanaerobaculia bacterium]|nr:RNA 2',3'-cyclic phosphodiesterase [Thermoanaerobaculia bacterium]
MRLFVAIEVPEPPRREVRRRVEGLRDRLPRARWVDLDVLHLTLLFLGETAEANVPVLAAKLRAVFSRFPPLPLRLAGGGTFPPGRPARVAWVGVESPPELLTLQADIAQAAVEALGCEPEERAYHPHVTLARCADPWRREAIEKLTNAFTGPVGPPFVAHHGVLFESKLSPKGARYRQVEVFPLEEDYPEEEA